MVYFSQESRQTNPFQVPQKAPIERDARSHGILRISKTSSFGFPIKGTLTEVPSTEPLER